MTLYIAVIAAVVLAMLLTLFTLGLGKAASKPRPKPDQWDTYFGGGELPTLADRMTAARDWHPEAAAVLAAEDIVRKAAAR